MSSYSSSQSSDSSMVSSTSYEASSSSEQSGGLKPMCVICKRRTDDEVTLGRMIYYRKTIHLHYFCLLTMTSIRPSLDKFAEIFGYKYDHVVAAVDKSMQNTCYVCQRRSAAIQCCVKDCGNYFHFPCGVNDDCLSTFNGDFRSYCFSHVQDPNEGKKFVDDLQKCLVCYNAMGSYNHVSTLISSCCLNEPDFKTRFIHKRCVLKYTRNAGYASMCITCDKSEDKEKWQEEMRSKGVFIPMEDAVWERDGSFKDHVKNKCEDTECKGSKKNDVYTCFICGCHPRHLSCVGAKKHENYICAKCDGESFVETVLSG